MFGQNGNGTQRPAQRKATRIPHEYGSRWRIIPQKAQAPANQRHAENQQLARPRHIVDVQILSEINPAHRIGQNAKRRRGNHHRHNRQTVQAIGEINGIGRANDDDHCKGEKHDAKRHQSIFQHRHSHLKTQTFRMQLSGHQRSNQSNHKPQSEPNSAGDPG